MNVITLKLSQTDQKKLYDTFSEFKSEKTPQYANWQLKPENCVITCYTSGKVVFQGTDAEVYASAFTNETISNTTDTPFPQAGSDEVGTGDYFGPVCVCATIVSKENARILSSLGVRDSKTVTDKEIREIAPKLMELLPHSLLILTPEHYNQVHASNNMNAIKAKLHNQAYINLSKKTKLPEKIIIDQFAEAPVYYNYLKYEPQVIRNIHFETKAEDKYPSVGAASIIARYAFLTTMDKMDALYDMSFAKGGGKDADNCGIEFVKKYGFDALSKVAKVHFKNTDKIKGNI